MKLSVIVATRNRAPHIRPCLDSIAAAIAKAAPLDAEIVIVDNGSTDNTSEIVKGWISSSPVPVRLLFEPKAGLSRAHNRALQEVQGELLAFTDDDCRLHPEHINDLLRYDTDDTEPVLRGGRIELGDPTDLPLSINITPERIRWNRCMNSARHENLGDILAGCNMAMRRAIAQQLGPFDERLGAGSKIGGADDTDYLLRAYLAGITVEHVPDMTVFHHHGRKANATGCALMSNYMRGNGALYVKYFLKYPKFCRPFYWDVKNAIKEIVSGTNTFLPDIGFSHKDKVICAVRGALSYISRV